MAGRILTTTSIFYLMNQTSMYVQARLNRLMAPNGNCFVVAIDHGFYNVPHLLNSIENMRDVVEAVILATPDEALAILKTG